MADSKISALTGASTPLAGTEVLPIVQSGATVKVAVSNLTAGRAVSATAVTASTGNFVVSTTNKGLTTGSGIPLGFGTNNATTAMTLDISGRLGVGVAPSAWTAGGAFVLQVGNYSALSSSGAYGGSYSNNAYYSSPNWVYITSDNAGRYDQISGTHSWYTAPGGAAGSNITFTKRMGISEPGIVTMSAYGAGAATFSAAGVISSVSDENWKRKDGVPSNPTEMLGKLQPGYWYYNDEKKDTFGVDRQLGFYAQNVNAAIGPEAAPEPESIMVTDDQGVETLQQKPWGYYDRSVLAVVVMALQEALATVKALEVRIQALEGKI